LKSKDIKNPARGVACVAQARRIIGMAHARADGAKLTPDG
jgi:hypothetical protein